MAKFTAKQVEDALEEYHYRKNPAWGIIFQMGFQIKDDWYGHQRVVDGIAWRRQAHKFTIDIIEIKVNRSDWLAELKSEKWKDTFEIGQRFWFAAPRGVIKEEELPAGCGLYHVNPDASKVKVRIARNAKSFTQREIKTHTILRLFMKYQWKVDEIIEERVQELLGDRQEEVAERIRKEHEKDRKIKKLEKQLERNPLINPHMYISLEELSNALGVFVWKDKISEEERLKRLREKLLKQLKVTSRMMGYSGRQLRSLIKDMDELVKFADFLQDLRTQSKDKVMEPEEREDADWEDEDEDDG